MQEQKAFLQEATENLSEILKPYQQQQNRRQQMVEMIRRCIQCAEKDDFLRLDELLKNRLAQEIENEPELQACRGIFERLRTYSNDTVDRYRIEFIEDVKKNAEEASLPIEIDFPRFSVLKGIEGDFDFANRQTTVNDKKLKSIDPKRIISTVLKIKRQLYDRPYDPKKFIDDLYQVYRTLVKDRKKTLGHPIPIQEFYREYVMSLQSKAFFQNMDKGKFKGYSLGQFAVDIWRYFQAGTGGTSGKYALHLGSGRNHALWLIDSDGQTRQITTISFQEHS
ncbi:MAG: hypothetical protein HQM14_03750 [SAR324 cluster bacterium]|nr:hypothetical protein [SAR324 cluster bacterium]